MTKDGYKQVMLSIDTYGKLKTESIKNKMSIGKLIDGLFEGISRPTLNPTAVGSNPSQPAIDFSDNHLKRNNVSIATSKKRRLE